MATPREQGIQAALEKYGAEAVPAPRVPAALTNVNEPPGPRGPMRAAQAPGGGLPLGMMLAGGALGAAFGPDDAKGQSALLGAAGGLGIGHMAHVGANKMREGISNLHSRLTTPTAPPAPVPGTPAFEAQLEHANSMNRVAADVGFTQSIGLPGGGSIGLSSTDRSDRLPGMHKWVPRSVLERIFSDVDQGMPDDAIVDAEANRGDLATPALGGGLGAMLARGAFPQGGWLPPVVGGMAGAAAGAGLHHMGEGSRRGNATEALKGIHGETDTEKKKPIYETATAPTPLTVSGGVLDA